MDSDMAARVDAALEAAYPSTPLMIFGRTINRLAEVLPKGHECEGIFREFDALVEYVHDLERRAKPETPAVVLMRRLRTMGVDIPDGSTLRRTRAGHVQRSAGAWSWFLVGPDGRELGIGSQFAVAALLKGKMVATRSFLSPDIHVDTIGPKEYLDPNRWRTYLVESGRA